MGRFFGWASALSLLMAALVGGLWASGSSSEPPDEIPLRRMQEHLARPLVEVTFDRVGLRDVIDFMRDVAFNAEDPNVGVHSGRYPHLPVPPPMDLDVDWHSIEGSGAGPNTPVTYRGHSIPLGTFLADVANQFGLACSADATMIHLSSKTGLRAAQSVYRERSLSAPRDLAVQLALGGSLWGGDLNGADIRIDDALDRISDITGVPVQIDWDELRRARLFPDAQIKFDVHRATIGDALFITLRDAHGPGVLQYEIRDGAIVVGTPKSFEKADARRSLTRRVIVVVVVLFAAGLFVVWRRSRRLATPASRRARVTRVVFVAGAIFLAIAVLPIDRYDFECCSRRVTFAWGGGTLNLWISPADPMRPYFSPPNPGASVGADSVHGRWGFEVVREAWPSERWTLAAPCKSTVLSLCVLPWMWSVIALAQFLRGRQRLRRGRCTTCGYDLRASGGQCPECGSVVDARLSPKNS